MTFLRALKVCARSWRLLVAALVIGALAGALVGILTRGQGAPGDDRRSYFAATQSIGVDPGGIPQVAIGQFGSLDAIGTYATSEAVTRQVATAVGGTPAALTRRVTTVVQPRSNSIDIVVVGRDAVEATTLAKAFGEALIDVYQRTLDEQSAQQAQALARRLDDLKARRQQVEEQLGAPTLSVVERDTLQAQRDALVNQYRITYDRFINLGASTTTSPPLYPLNVAVADPIDAATYEAALERGRTGNNHLDAEDAATVSLTATEPSWTPHGPVPLAVLGSILGVVLGIAIVLVRDRFDGRLRGTEEFADAYGLPVLCAVPALGRHESSRTVPVVHDRPYSPAAEAYRALRSSVLLLGEDCRERRGALVVMITSAEPNEGKSTTCANLAITLAESGRSVLVVNCDYQRPSLHRFFGIDDRPGEVQTTSVPGALRVVTNVALGPRLPGQMPAEQIALIESKRQQFDVIVVDTAPVLSSSNPLDLVAVADLVVLVGREGRTRADRAGQAVETLQRHRGNLAGVVVTGVPSSTSAYYYAYGSGLPVSEDPPVTTSGSPPVEPSVTPTLAPVPTVPLGLHPDAGAGHHGGGHRPVAAAGVPDASHRIAGTATIRWVETTPN